jgi:elongation factor Ts
MEQVYIRDGDKKIKDLLVDHIARLGENMVIGNMSRFAIGE